MLEVTKKRKKPGRYLSTSRWCWVKDPGLHFTGQGRVYWEDDQLWDIRTERFHSFVQDLTSSIDLLLTRQEHQDVSCTVNYFNYRKFIFTGIYSFFCEQLCVLSYLEAQ